MIETTLLLARHGATPSNLRRPYILQGQGVDHSLDPLGEQQAEALARSLADEKLAAVYASPLKRAVETATRAGRPHGLEPTVVEGITEADVGQWEGKSWDEIGTGWPKERDLHDEDPAAHGYPGGESFLDVRDRVVPVLESLAQRHPGEVILVVGHNVVNRAALAHWIGLPIRYARRLPQNNAAYNVLSFEQDRPKVRTINVAHHLKGLLPPD